jgi:hypothetical protein
MLKQCKNMLYIAGGVSPSGGGCTPDHQLPLARTDFYCRLANRSRRVEEVDEDTFLHFANPSAYGALAYKC